MNIETQNLELKQKYRNWQINLFRSGWFSSIFVRIMGRLATPIYNWAFTLMSSDLQRANMICDVGCGNFLMFNHISMKIRASKFLLVEPSPSQLKAGRNLLLNLKNENRAAAIQGPAEQLPFPDNSIDMLYSTGSINLWVDPVKGIEECARVVKPGGVIWIFDQRPCNSITLILDALFVKRIFGLGLPGFTVEETIKIADQAGLNNPELNENMSLYGLRWKLP